MPGKTELELDQLWFTLSKSGLGSLPMGFRVRAASEGLYDTQGMRYRRVNRFLSYELPEGASASEFNSRIAPISLSFVNNGDECLLIRKVFTGLDDVGRNGAFFTHLIAGLPRGFTAREAIELWYCPELWAESEHSLSPNETTLAKISYSRVLTYVQNSQTSFNFAPTSEKLQNLLLLILSKGLPPHITIRGHSTLIASLIYGLTHTLPMKLLPNLTFTTYESDTQESEVLIAGTINGAELQDITRLQVQPEQASGPISEDIQRYVTVAVNSLVNTNTEKLYGLIDEIERRDHVGVDDLIELFKRRFRFGGPTLKQLEDIILHPVDNVEDLLDPAFQTEATQLLLTYPDYWEQRGKEVFQKVQGWLAPGAKTALNEQARDALSRCLNEMAEYLFSNIRTELAQGNMPRQSVVVLNILAHPSTHPGLYQRMLTEFAQEPLYRQIISDELWSFHLWLLSCAKLMQPLPAREQMVPWLSVPSWDRLDRVLRLGLPAEWEYAAMFELLISKRDIPKSAIIVFKTYEAKFTSFMRDHLRLGSEAKNQNFMTVALRLFEAIIWYDEQESSYPNRVALLLTLLNAVPNDPGVIEALFSRVQFASPYQLSIKEFGSVVADSLPEVMAARSASPSLMTYIQEFILSLTPKHLMYPNTLTLLEQFQQSNVSLRKPDTIARSVNFWLAIHKFLTSRVFNEELLQNIKPALSYLIPELQQRGQNIWHTFVEELAPHLVALVENEYQLGSLLYVFESSHVVASWDLLNALATHAGERLAEDLSRLTPYMLCGIREYARAGLPKEALDANLHKLFKRVSDNTLSDVDRAASIRIWPELINIEWKGWRDRRNTKPSWRDNLPIMGKVAPQQQRKPTGPQPSLKLPVQRPPTEQQPIPGLPTSPHDTSSLPKQAGDAFPRPTISLGENNASSQKLQNPRVLGLQIIVTIGGREDTIHVNNYERLCHIWLQVLQFWSHMLTNKLTKVRSKGITSELHTIMLLQDELKRLSDTTRISELLVEYLVDDVFIKFEVDRISQVEDKSFLHSSNYIAGRLEEFKSFMGTTNYQLFSKIVTEQAIKDVIQKLILRYHLIQYMDNQKWDWNKWLAKESKSAKYKYQKVQTQA